MKTPRFSQNEIADAAGRLVKNEVRGCKTSLVEDLLKRDIYSIDEIENLFSDDEDSEMQEILEWWEVSQWLADLLSAKGEPILRNDNHDVIYWGRTTSGQMLLADYVIEQIAIEKYLS